MKKYELVLEHNRKDLNEKITSMLNDGWSVSGSLSITTNDEGFLFLYQPMIKHDLGSPE